jgi:hypothetical protein
MIMLGSGILKVDSSGIGFGSAEASIAPLNFPSADHLLTLFVNDSENSTYYNVFGVHEDALPASLGGVDAFSFGPSGTFNWSLTGKTEGYYTFSALSNDIDFMQGPGKTTGLKIEFDYIDVQSLSFKLLQNAYYFDSFDVGEASPQRIFVSASILDYGYVAPVPLPGAVWLFGSALGLFGYLAKRKANA